MVEEISILDLIFYIEKKDLDPSRNAVEQNVYMMKGNIHTEEGEEMSDRTKADMIEHSLKKPLV